VGGLVTGLAAGAAGMVDYTDIRDDDPAKKTATLHMILNLVALGLFGAGAGLRFSELDTERTAALPLFVSIVALAVLSYSGYLGGHLVYGHGIGVGRHRRRTRTPERTIRAGGSGTNAAVAVADDAAIGEGETLRVDIGGVIVAVARVDGALHAFQEFCTHRYGPLSAGALQGCELVCPWHNSRFDVRTGRVTQGPAKIDLRVFRVESREGRIWLEVPRNE
jgi:nitrite reductase/ring-hydroxylating ferredoxin subunit